jgi:accessory gene regulator B
MEILKKFKEETIANYIVEKLKEKQDLSRIQELKCKLGIEVCLTNLGKGFVVYLVAALLQVLPLTILFHSAYFIIRISARGVHAQKSSTCTWVSVLLFVLLPLVVNEINLSKIVPLVVSLFVYICLYRYAPQGTKKNQVGTIELRKKLRNRALVGYSICVALIFGTDSTMIMNQVFFGSLLAVVCILPLTYKLLGE